MNSKPISRITAAALVGTVSLHVFVSAEAKAPPSKILGQLMATANSTDTGVTYKLMLPDMVLGKEGAKLIPPTPLPTDLTPRST